MSGQNVITAIGAQITEFRSEMQAQINGLQVQITALRTEMNTLNKFIWALISLLFIPMLGCALQDPHVVTQTDFGRDKIWPRC